MKKQAVIAAVLAALLLGALATYHGMMFSHDDLPVSVGYHPDEGLQFRLKKSYILEEITDDDHLLEPAALTPGVRSFSLPVSRLKQGQEATVSIQCSDEDQEKRSALEYHIIGQEGDSLRVETYQHDFLIDAATYTP